MYELHVVVTAVVRVLVIGPRFISVQNAGSLDKRDWPRSRDVQRPASWAGPCLHWIGVVPGIQSIELSAENLCVPMAVWFL